MRGHAQNHPLLPTLALVGGLIATLLLVPHPKHAAPAPPIPGTAPGDTYSELSPGSASTYDSQMGTSNAMTTRTEVWQWNVQVMNGIPHGFWAHAPDLTPVSVYATIQSTDPYDCVWWAGNQGTPQFGGQTVLTRGGYAYAYFQGIAANADRPVRFSALSGSLSGGKALDMPEATGTLHHTRFQPTMSHAIISYPPNGTVMQSSGVTVYSEAMLHSVPTAPGIGYQLITQIQDEQGTPRAQWVRVMPNNDVQAYGGGSANLPALKGHTCTALVYINELENWNINQPGPPYEFNYGVLTQNNVGVVAATTFYVAP